MGYAKRMVCAAAASLLLHATVLMSTGLVPRRHVAGLVAKPPPLVLNLQPAQEPPETRRLIDTHETADEPAEPTDLISDKNAKAADLSDLEGERIAPHFDEPSDFDQAPSTPPDPTAIPAKAESLESREGNTTIPLDARLRGNDSEKKIDKDEPPEHALPDRTPIAKAKPHEPMTPLHRERGSSERGRVEGGVKRKGFTGFEAMQDEMAPYLRMIRDRVERRWNAALVLRYSGTSPTHAVIDCAINADGEVVRAEIIEPGSSASFAPLCREAIETAGPFGPFPFEIPKLYRSQDLEIQWTFSFLK
ncbi:MAG TPA: hypothetical protein ENN80_01680 [Candidatus Hydrogenedentes bacterium]|nr:hypothetical protein [Candidatus Hydrogenedentota bacterium]